ncbi:MAG: T9SS type A sorting domain-containing protein, partial [Ignavibacteria bacterium]
EIERKVIEASGFEKKWENIGFVKGNGNSNSPKQYSFIDNFVSGGKVIYRLKQIDIDGTFSYSNEIEVDLKVPKELILYQNYPNPSNPSTTISFTIEKDGPVTLKVYDILGREIVTLVNSELKAGEIHRVKFDGSNLSSGVYFYRLESNNKGLVKKFTLIK